MQTNPLTRANGHHPTQCPAWIQMGGLRFNCSRRGGRAHRHHWFIKFTTDGPIEISWTA